MSVFKTRWRLSANPTLAGALAAILIVVLLSISPLAVAAASSGDSAPTPPIAIGGFEYRFIEQGRIHMNLCKADDCVPGSKVSYTIYGPITNPDFAQFRESRKTILEEFRSRVRDGVTLKLEAPERAGEPPFTAFSSMRIMRSSDGATLFTKSTHIFSPSVTISLISSAQDRETAVANSNTFQLGLMTWSAAIGQRSN